MPPTKRRNETMKLPKFSPKKIFKRNNLSGTQIIHKTENPIHTQNSKQSNFYKTLLPALLITTIWLIASLTITYKQFHYRFDYVIGQKVEQKIVSKINFDYIDPELTELQRSDAKSRINPIFTPTPYATTASKEHLEKLINNINAVQNNKTTKQNITKKTINIIKTTTKEQIQTINTILNDKNNQKTLKQNIDKLLQNKVITKKDLQNIPSDKVNAITLIDQKSRTIEYKLPEIKTPEQIAQILSKQICQDAKIIPIITQLLTNTIQPNILPNYTATLAAGEKAAKAIQPVIRHIKQNDLLIQQDKIITQADLTLLKDYGQELQNKKIFNNNRDLLFYPIICILLLIATLYALYISKPQSLIQTNKTILITVIIISQLILARSSAELYHHHLQQTFFLYTILPFAFAATLLSPLVGVRIAIICSIFTSIIISMQNDNNFQILLTSTLASFPAAILMRNARKRLHTFVAGFTIGAVIFLVSTLFLFKNQIPASNLPKLLAFSITSGIITSLTTSTILPIFEYIFSITTQLSLLELSDFNHPLLKRLQIEAPGTYHHSLMVATIAEQAAKAIGANPLMARVCSYFHDIGKLRHPEYYSENTNGQDMHQELSPSMSCLVILNHVKEGLTLAYKYNLKKQIREAIRQHHGTSLVYYFYRRAQDQNESKQEIAKEKYRYPGPRPRRKEIAIISLADSCEAAARSMDKPTANKINALVENIINKRIIDQQLNKANLTFAELDIVKHSISKTLTMMLHGRIKYPKDKNNENNPVQKATTPKIQKSSTINESNKNCQQNKQTTG